MEYRDFTLQITVDSDDECVIGEIKQLVGLNESKYKFSAKTISELKKKFYQLIDERIEELGQDVFGDIYSGGDDKVPQKLLDILKTDYDEYMMMNPKFYLF